MRPQRIPRPTPSQLCSPCPAPAKAPPPRRVLACLAAWILGAAWTAPVGAASEGPRVRVVEESSGGFTLRITIPEPRTSEVVLDGVTYLAVEIPGFAPGSDAPSGSPDLPMHGFPFGLPDGASARIARVTTVATTSFQGARPVPAPERRILPGDPVATQEYTYRPDVEVYGSRRMVPSTTVELGTVHGFRHQRIQSLVVRPVQVVPATGDYQVLREVEVQVRFDADSSRPVRPGRRPARMDAPGWEETYDQLLTNRSSARNFRTRASLPALAPRVGPGDVYLRIRLGESGLCRIPYADLAAAGWPAGVPASDVRVEERGYDKYLEDPFTVSSIPRRVEDTNGNGTFDIGDYLVFHGMNYKDRFQPVIADARYSYHHSYWVTPSAGAGRDLVTVDGYPAGTEYAPLDSFPSAETYERNLVYINNPKDSGSSIFPIYDALYWLGTNEKLVDLGFPVVDVAPGASFRVRARWQGVNTVFTTRTHIVSLDLNGQVLLAEGPATTFFDLNPFLYEGTIQPATGRLNEGSNTLTVKARTENPSVNSSGCLFDWFEVTYDRLFRARNNRLQFNTGAATGPLEITVSGFNSPDVLVLDITDPLNPFALSPLVVSSGLSYRATLRITVAGGPRSFLALVPGDVIGLPASPYAPSPDLGTATISPGLPRDLLVDGEGSDYILITHPSFRAAWQPLVDHREAQGHRVFLCDVWEIYDQFAGGDKTPWAIQRFLLQAFRRWDPSPSMLFLGGDASEDYRKDTERSDPDWVPTLMHFGAVPGAAGLELAGTDTWYAAFLREGDPEYDVVPDMHVARVPAGTVTEIADYVQKVIDYESMDPTDAWRNRGFFLADDRYSSGILQSSSYCYVSGEGVFKNTSLAMIDSIHVQAGLADFRADAVFLSDYLDTAAVLNRNPGTVPDCPGTLVQTRNYTRGAVTPAILDSLSRGYLIWEFTGHANKNTFSHEGVLDHRSSSPRDMDKINNLGRPFLFLGYACHLMEFEGVRENEVGQSVGEELLLGRNRGAVGVMASSAYEWLHTNPLAQIYTTRPLFWNLPRDASGRPRRLWGEAVTRGLVALISENNRGDVLPMIRTYQTFGDPALRIDVTPASFAGITVDGNPWTPGSGLTAPSFQDSIEVQARISDDVDVASIRVLEAGVALPGTQVRVTPPSPSQDGKQSYEVAFRSPLRLGTYDVILEAEDWAGRPSGVTFPVRFDTRFDRNGTPIQDGDVVEATEPVGITVISPVPLAAESFQVLADGAQLPGVVPQGGPLEWRLVVSDPFWEAGEHLIELRVSDPGARCVPDPCPLVRSLTFTTPGSDEALAVRETYFYPNPVEGDGGKYVYRLNRSARSARVTLYSLSGRRVRQVDSETSPDLTARAGLNAFSWDLRDERGDRVANGVYLLVLEVRGANGEVVRPSFTPERIAVTR